MNRTTTTQNDTAIAPALYMTLDVGATSWHAAWSDGSGKPHDATIDRSTVESARIGFVAEVAKARSRLGLSDDAPVEIAYEAGRDGFWMAHWMRGLGWRCHVVDPSSILVNRRAKQRKTDAIDARALLHLLVRHLRGEPALRVVAIPSVEAEDAREMQRSLDRLAGDRRRAAMRVQSLLFKHGIDRGYSTDLADELVELRTGDGRLIGVELCQEIRLLCKQIAMLDEHIHMQDQERASRLAKPQTPTDQIAHNLDGLRGVGPIGATLLAVELFGWRDFANGKHLGSFLGLTPTPWASGSIERDQGISKAGSGRLRALMIQLAWMWLRHQPDSELSQWYQTRFGETGKRSKRVGIVALSRKLAVALWRYTAQGIVPAGATFKDDSKRTRPHARRRKRAVVTQNAVVQA